MQLSKFLPKKFSARLIGITLILGLIPVIIFAFLMNIFANRFPIETNRAIQQGQEEQWQRSGAVLRQMAADSIRQKAMDVALQLDLYLQAHSDMTAEDLQNDPEFREIAVQPVGKTGYTAVQDSDTAINRFHRSAGIENLDLHSLSDKLPDFWAIMEASLGGRYSGGFYQWKEPDGQIRDKFMYIVPLDEKTADGVRFGVAATTYVDEFTPSLQAAQDVSRSTSRYTMITVNRLIRSFRDTGFLFMGLGVMLISILAFWVGIYFSRAIIQLREATRAVNQGDLDVHVKPVMSGEVGELIEYFNRMVEHLAATTVKREELAASEERYRDIIDSIEEGYYEVDIAGNFIFVNDSICGIYGYSRDKLIGMNYRGLMDEEAATRVYKIYNKVYETGVPCKLVEWLMATKHGSKRFIEMSASLIKDSDGNRIGFRGVSRDVTERYSIQDDLRNEKEKFESLAKNAPYGMSVVNPDGKYKYINPKFTEIFGYNLEDIPTGKAWFELAYPDPDYRKEIASVWVSDMKTTKSGESRPREFKVTCKDGSVKDIYFCPVMLKNRNNLVTYEDITDRRRLETQLRQATKMEAIGTLAGGIAHDFNNLLMAVEGNVSLMLSGRGSSHPYYDRLKNIEQYVQMGAGLTKQLLGFARGGKYEVRPTDMNDLIKKSSEMFGRARKEISVHSRYQEDISAVEVDRGQMEQVLLNLYVNAWQAMPGGGELYIQTENLILEENEAKLLAFESGKYVKISVTDTGIGMDEGTRQRIFEPFYTTRDMGRGTGLGLASAYGIIKNHGGIINVRSEAGQGTTFEIYLPASEKEVAQEKEISKQVLKGTGTVLFVDDEEMVVDVGREMLKGLGYEVLVAGSGEEAVEIFKTRKDEIDLVILDMIMPGLDGGDVYDRMKEIGPGIKVLLSSGYSLNGQAKEILERGCNGFVQKPFNLMELSRKVREILDQ